MSAWSVRGLKYISVLGSRVRETYRPGSFPFSNYLPPNVQLKTKVLLHDTVTLYPPPHTFAPGGLGC